LAESITFFEVGGGQNRNNVGSAMYVSFSVVYSCSTQIFYNPP
jgi:hypothetical protein